MSGLLDGYDAVLLDLDGTVVRGAHAVGEAPEVVNELREAGRAVQFITNNASRAPEEVAEQLTGLGVRTTPEEVLTSGQAAATLLESLLPAGSAVLVVGAAALVAAVRSVGLRPVAEAADHPVAVVQGHSAETGWPQLSEACLAIRGGARWIACNVDPTLPSERGLLPGNGAMVAALQTATGHEPTVAGKPARTLLDTAVNRIGAQHPLVVGDRLDTDIAGARAAGLDALLVLSGVSDAVAALAAPAEQRPTHLAADVRVLREPLDRTLIQPRRGWRVEIDQAAGCLLLSSDGAGADALDAVRTLCAVWWEEHSGSVRVRACDDAAATALEEVGLA
ncbi:MAG: HAD-IIA family hydrolase [Pseudonocardia sp.]|nr:HAD-IIA family hydrolase [Pseudonocardia sp.]